MRRRHICSVDRPWATEGSVGARNTRGPTKLPKKKVKVTPDLWPDLATRRLPQVSKGWAAGVGSTPGTKHWGHADLHFVAPRFGVSLFSIEIPLCGAGPSPDPNIGATPGSQVLHSVAGSFAQGLARQRHLATAGMPFVAPELGSR